MRAGAEPSNQKDTTDAATTCMIVQKPLIRFVYCYRVFVHQQGKPRTEESTSVTFITQKCYVNFGFIYIILSLSRTHDTVHSRNKFLSLVLRSRKIRLIQFILFKHYGTLQK